MTTILDTKDAAILAARQAEWDAITGPRVGDWCIMPDGTERRFTHDWGADIQTTMPGRDASFYFSGDHVSFSGSLDRAIPKAALTNTGERKPGRAWFFHHGEVRAHNAVQVAIDCRVFRYQPRNA